MIIETDRLVLRALKEEDAGFFSSMMKDPAVYKYILKQEPWSDSKIGLLFRRQREILTERGFCLYGVVLKGSRQLTGYCGLQPLECFSESFADEVGASWAFHPDYWGMGLATEAARAVLEQAFARTALEDVKALIHPANRGSMRVAGKLGFQFEDLVFRNNRLRLMYSVPRSAFEDVFPNYREPFSYAVSGGALGC